MTNPLSELIAHGQSMWLDNIRRGYTRSGELAKLVREDGLRGVTSNPTIFEKAFSTGKDYDEAIKAAVEAGKDAKQIYDELTTEDIRDACDVLAPVYASTAGADGFVSMELPPKLAKETQGSIAEALRLWQLIERSNVMIKVPATDEGIPAVRELIAKGVNVNITLMFGEQYYERVIDAYLSGLEDRRAKALPLHDVSSVASCFVSRVDTETDRRIEAAMQSADAMTKRRLAALRGKTAIANSKRLYRCYQRSVSADRFKRLAAVGARPQRPLWASTSTKNPNYPDTYYVEALIGADTVDTMPPATIDAFRDHGKVADTLVQGMAEADRTIEELSSLGIGLKSITDKLLADGLIAFEESFSKLMGSLDEKSSAVAL
ncbi:MAG: transaldolase [Candidatus Eremiobacteraeota bacterium]|nr:transaldolase [Candidatus Eremiobacteraeota bacterium]